MHNRVKALIVAAMFATNSVSPTLNALANEIDRDIVSEEIVNTVDLEEEKEGSEEETEDGSVPESGLEIENEEPKEKAEDDSVSEGNLKTENEIISEKTEASSNLEQENVTEENYDISTVAVNKLEIKPNKGSFDWGYYNSNEVSVILEFDNQTKEKIVEITLPEGMVFDRYPVVGNATESVESEGTDTDLAVIKRVLKKPTKDPITGLYSGTLIYELNEGVSKGKITFNASVDRYRYRYYGEKEIPKGIEVVVKEDNVQVDSTSINVKATDNKQLGSKNKILGTNATGRTAELQPGGTGNTYSYFRNTTSGVKDDDNGIRSFTYIKSAVLTMYYPENTTLVKVNNLPDKAVCKELEAENKVVMTMPETTINNSSISLTYKVNDDAEFVELSSPKYNTMEVEYYDGHKETIVATKLDTVKVVDPKSVGSVIKMETLDGYYHDYNGNSLSTSGYIYLNNQTIVEYKDQVFEYEFSGWNTRKVLLPDSMEGIINIRYTVFGDPTEHSITVDQLADYQGDKRLIDADKLNLPSDQYFEKVTFEVPTIPVGFIDSTSGRNSKLAISFGELQPGVDKGSTTISIYPKGNKAAGTTEVEPIIRVEKPEKIAISSGTPSLKNESGYSKSIKGKN